MAELEVFNTKEEDFVIQEVKREMVIFTGAIITFGKGYEFFATPGQTANILGPYQRSLSPERAIGPASDVLATMIIAVDVECKIALVPVPGGKIRIPSAPLGTPSLRKAIESQLPEGWQVVLYATNH